MKKALLIIIFAALIGFFAYSFFAPQETYQSRFIETSEGKKDTADKKPVQDNTRSVEETLVLSCEDELREQVVEKNIDYKEGSILVAFANEITFSEAIDVIGEYEMSWVDAAQEEEEFDDRGWLTVATEKGLEFEALCDIKRDQAVRSAALNILFSLHE